MFEAMMNDQSAFEATFLQGVLDAIPDACAILDSNGDIVQINREWTNLVRASGLQEDADKNFLLDAGVEFGEGVQSERVIPQILNELIQGERRDFYLDYARYLHQQKRTLMLHLRRFEFEGVPYIVATYTDISRRVLAEQEILRCRKSHESTRALAESVRVKVDEFRTPLSVINTSLYLHNRHASPDKPSSHLEEIVTQAQLLTDLTNQLTRLVTPSGGASAK